MSGHTAEPLYSVHFSSGDHATEFVRAIRRAMHFEGLHRQTPPGPLVIYGPRRMDTAGEVMLFVTSGILRAAEILQLALLKGSAKLDGDRALPRDAIVLFANLGGTGPVGG